MANEQKNQFPRLQFVTPIGRLVAGDLAKKSDIGHGGKKKDTPSFYFALAIHKSSPGLNELLGAIFHHTVNSYAHAPNIAQLARNNPLPGPFVPEPQRRPFAWKVQDGDWPSNVTREGWAGCYVFGFGTPNNLNICDAMGAQIPGTAVHLGMLATVSGNAVINGLQDANCGIYLNPSWTKIVSDGPLIVTGLTAEQAFKDAAPLQLPPGYVPFVAGGGGQVAPQPLPLPAPAPAPYSQAHQPVAGPGYQPQPPQGNAPAYAQAAPAYGATVTHAPGTPQQFQAIASPSNPNGWPPVQPHTAFVQG